MDTLTDAQRKAYELLMRDGLICKGEGVTLGTVRVLARKGLVTLDVKTRRHTYSDFNGVLRTSQPYRDWTARLAK